MNNTLVIKINDPISFGMVFNACRSHDYGCDYKGRTTKTFHIKCDSKEDVDLFYALLVDLANESDEYHIQRIDSST